jgi:hypothetical protein
MNFLTSRLKKFDVHVKTVEGVSQQTFIGALFTVLTFAISLLLLYSEVKYFMAKENVHHMVIDQGSGQETVRLDFDFEFHAISCEGKSSSCLPRPVDSLPHLDLGFSQEVIRGTVHSHTDSGNISFTPLSSSSCQVHGYIVTDKVGGNFRFKVKSASNDLANDLIMQQFGQFTRGVKDSDPDLRWIFAPPSSCSLILSPLPATPLVVCPFTKLTKTKSTRQTLTIRSSSWLRRLL